MADELRKLLPNIYVINFNITAYDVLRLIIDRKFWGKTIGLITVRMNISGLELVSKVLGAASSTIPYTPLEGIEARIWECLAQGASVIIGGTLSNIVGKRMGVPIQWCPSARSACRPPSTRSTRCRMPSSLKSRAKITGASCWTTSSKASSPWMPTIK